ncbi:uncharacterized protein DFL_008936 [Arthrobotrys flagrans]|uniref:Uncharacterized protein n=1 Tax=Arthrobotrys flagrans TaxID=97331 RepID=A0A436ZQ71_ARTFL|nr:hypothetical protein DFL_008936 [Arthrobotrys flagrans]
MLKRILKGRNQTSKDHSNSSSRAPLAYDERTVGPSSSSMSAMSAAPVDYRTSPPKTYSASSSLSIAPAEYGGIRPDNDPYFYQPQTQRSPLRPYSGSQFPPVPEYSQSSPTNPFGSANEVQYELATPASLVSPAAIDYTRGPPLPQSPYSHELESSPISSPAAQYTSYGNPGEDVTNQRPPYNYQEHTYPPQTPAPLNTASSLYSPPFSSVSNSTAPTSVYSSDRPNYAQNTPNTYADSTTASTDDPNVSKFAVRIFCQRKRGEEDTHEELPRDIREFRLANLALIKLAAGGERYVLLDAVFGELDKAIAPLLEKHWYLTLDTTVQDHYVPGGKHVVAIGNIMVAYRGTQSTLYADFKKDDDYARFKLEMEYAMNTIRNSNSSSSPNDEKQLVSFPEKKPRYRY